MVCQKQPIVKKWLKYNLPKKAKNAVSSKIFAFLPHSFVFLVYICKVGINRLNQ